MALTWADPAVQELAEKMARKVDDGTAEKVRRLAMGTSVAGSQTGLAGIALELARCGYDDDDRAALGEAALRHLGTPAARFGLALAGTSGYGAVRWAACQEALAKSAVTGTGLAGLGLSVMLGLGHSYAEERAEVGREALKQLGTPGARLALQAGGTSGYAAPRTALYETFLASPEGDPIPTALQALDRFPKGYEEERTAAAREVVARMAQGRPALNMALQASETSGYPAPQGVLLEAGLQNAEVREPKQLAQLGLAMVRAVPRGYEEEAAAAASSVMRTLERLPELAEVTGMARAMMNSSGYQAVQNAIADRMLEGAALGTPLAQATYEAYQAVPRGYEEEAAAAAREALARLQKDDPVAQMGLQAMTTSGYHAAQNAVARATFEALAAPERRPLAQVALAILEAFPSGYQEEAVSAGRALASFLGTHYSAARDRLDRASMRGDGSNEQLQMLREAIRSLKDEDDDRASILKMAEALQGKAEKVAIVQQEDAVIVGGIRVKRRTAAY
ncbi:MAG: hypothetical protein AB1758_23475 [Candidatus Eremiobacterota bacterium]